MHSSVDVSRSTKAGWVYASLTVFDGDRSLKPSEVAFDRIVFDEAPHLQSSVVEILLVNGDEQQRHTAAVLPHDPEAKWIPIELGPVLEQ
jgi:hypothetical protein